MFKNLFAFCLLFFLPLNAYAQTKLSASDSQEIYAMEKIDESKNFDAAVLNLVPFALGSRQQGDYLTAASVITIDTAGVSMMAFGAVDLFFGAQWLERSSLFVTVGLLTLLLGRLVGFTMPWLSVPLQNEFLTYQLKPNETKSLDFKLSQGFSVSLYQRSF